MHIPEGLCEEGRNRLKVAFGTGPRPFFHINGVSCWLILESDYIFIDLRDK